MQNLFNKYKTLIIVIGVLLFIIFTTASYFADKYNNMVTLKNNANVQWAQVETQLQRRFDLTPQLVASVKQVLKQENEVFGKIADARSRYSGAATLDDKVGAANDYNSALSRLLVITENYPELKSSQNIQSLSSSIEGTENRLSVERGRFNEVVGVYNAYVLRFPNNMISKIFSFSTINTFKAVEGSDIAPNVDALFK